MIAGTIWIMVSNNDNQLKDKFELLKVNVWPFCFVSQNFILTATVCKGFQSAKLQPLWLFPWKYFFLHSCMLWLSNHVRLEIVFLLLVCLFHAKPESSYILKEDFWSHLCSALLVSFLLGNLDYFRVSCSDGQLWYDLMTSHSCGGNLVIWHLPSVLSLMEATVVFFRIQIRVLKTVFDPNSFQQVECKGYSGQNK